MLTTHNVRFLSSSASLFPSSVPTVGSANNISFLFTVSESVSELQNWCYREPAVRSNSLDFCRAVSQSASVGRAKCSQFTCMQINRPDVLEIKASEDDDPVHIDIDFSTSLTVQLIQWGLWCLISIIYSSHTHRNLASGPGSSTSGFTKILRHNIFWGLLSQTVMAMT